MLFFVLKIVNAQTISNTKVNALNSNIHLCLGNTYTVTFDTSGFGNTNSTFQVQLSNSSGLFFSNIATSIISSATTTTLTIPTFASFSNSYKLRILRISPAISTIGDTLSNLTISKPTPNFTTTNNNTCAGTSVVFNNTSNGNGVGILSYSWDFSAASGAPTSPNTNVNPTVSFNPPAGNGIVNYDVILTATDSFGCTSTATQNVLVRKLPAPNFTFNNNVCANSNVNFNNTSIGNAPLSYVWNFGTTAGAPNSPNTNVTPTVQFNPSAGGGIVTYITTLTVTDVYGCANSIINNVNVKQTPDFYLDTNVIQSANGVEWDPVLKIYSNCFSTPTNSNFTFSDSLFIGNFLSISNIVVNWGDATSTTYTSPFLASKLISHVYNILGYFTMNITINNSNGCSNSLNYNFYNGYQPSGGILNPPGYLFQYCNPVTLAFPVDTANTNYNPPGTIYTFSVNDGSQNQIFNQNNLPSIIYHTFTKTSCGTTSINGPFTYQNAFQVSLNISNPCSPAGGSRTPFRIITKLTADFNSSSNLICNNNIITFTNTSKGNYFSSNFSTCSNILNKLWSITPSTGWTLTSGNMSPTSILNDIINVNFIIPGTYQIKLIISQPTNPTSGCSSDTITKSICVQPTPIPNFTLNQNPASGCINNVVSITNTSNTLVSCGSTQYIWSVWDSLTSLEIKPTNRFSYLSGTDSSSVNPVFSFSQKGWYKIRLQIVNKCAGIFTKDTFIIIKEKPIVSLPNDINYCDSQTIAFNLSSINHKPIYDSSYGTISVFKWTIIPKAGFTYTVGDSTSKFPTIKFTNFTTSPITYKVILTATNECGESVPDTQNITINPRPLASASSVTSKMAFCSGGSTNIVLTNNLSSIVRYTWTAYPSSVNISGYSSQLTGVTGPIIQTLTNSGSVNETVLYRIVARDTITGCLGDSVSITITVYPIPRAIANSQNICSAGQTNIALSSNVTGTLFTWTSIAKGLTTGYRDTSNAVSGPIINTLINNSASRDTVIYSIKATSNGCFSPDTFISVIVYPIPLTNGGFANICSNDTAKFTASSSVSGTTFAYTAILINGNATGFSNGNGSISQKLTNTGNTDALVRYIITPTGPLPTNCVGQSINFDVTIKPKPILALTTSSSICSGSQTNIALNSSVINTFYKYVATLISGTNTTGFYSKLIDTLSPITQIISNTGVVNSLVRYAIIPTANLCIGDTQYHDVTIFPGVNAGSISAPDTVCSGSNSGTLNLSGNTGAVVRWEQSVAPFTNWSIINNVSSTQNYLNLTQTTWYRAVIQSGGLCPTVNTSPLIITVDSVTIAGNLTGTDTVCTGTNSGILTLLNKRGSIVNWQLSNSLPTWNNIGTTTANPYSYANLTQTTWYRVSVKNGVCPAAFSDSVRIQVDELPSAAIAPNKQICATSLTIGTDDFLVANPISVGTGLWTYLSGPNAPTIVSPSAAKSAINNMAIGTHLIQWKVSNGKCIANTANLQFVVYPPLVSTITSNQTICSGQTPSQLIGTSTTGGNGSHSYEWQISPNGTSWTSISGANSTNYQPGVLTANTFYRKVVTSGNCIVPSNIILITVLPSISTNTISPNATLCFGNASPTIMGSNPIGGDGIYSYQWQKFNGSTWENLTTSDTLKDYSPGILINTTIFRRIVKSSFCNGLQANTSNSVTITINPLPVVNAGGDSSKCQNQLTYPLYGSPNGGTWSGIGVTNNTFNPSDMPLGNYTLVYTFTNANGCVNSDTEIISVIAPPIVNAGNNFSICQNASSIQLTGFSPIGGAWSGNGVSAGGLFNPTIAGAGSFYLKYLFKAGSGCQGIDSLLVTVNPRPNGDFILANQICPNGIISLTANVNNIANVNGFAWTISNNAALSNNILSSYNNANTTINFPENKSNIDVIYTIKLNTITDFGCIDSNTHTISLRRRPLAQFTTGSNINCGTAMYSMVNGTSNIPTTGLSYIWSVSPSINVLINTINSRNPQIILPVNNSGISLPYNISLIVSRNDGTLSCSDTVNNSLTIYPKPIISFSALPKDSGCSPLLVNFSNSSNPRNTENINTMSFLWNFGIYGTDTSKNTQRIFTNSGIIDSTINVKVIGTTQWGCKDSFTQIIKVYPLPKANFSSSIYTSCAPFLINNSIVTLTQYPIANSNYLWQILDKSGIVITSSTGTTIPTYSINSPNDTVYYRLITSHTRGCKSDTLTRMFTTIANPQASFTMVDSTGCTPLTVSFNNNSIVGVTSSWYISNGAIPTNSNSFAVVFNNFSNKNDTTYTVKLVITAGTGCIDSITKNITVYPKPKAIFSLPSNACPLSSLNPNNKSIFKIGNVKYGWSIIEPTATIINDTTLANPLFSFGDNQGTFDTLFNFILLVTSFDGCIDRDTQNIRIFKRPLAFFTVPPTFCGSSNVNILNSTPLNSNWLWSSTPIIGFNSSTIKNPAVTFPINSTSDSINYNIKLIATRNGTTCVDSTTRLVTIFPRPKADYTITTKDSCSSRLVKFTNKSIAKNSEPFNSMSFLWTYLNNSFSTLDTSGFFTNSQINDSIYKIRLIATSQHGCKDTLIDSVIVRPDAKASFTYTNSTSCAPFLINSSNLVTNVYSNANSIYKWYANNNLLGISNSFPGYTIATANDSVLIKLVTISKNGCKNDSMEAWFKTINNPKPNFLAIDSIGCSPLLVNFNNTSTPLNGLSYKWEFGNASNQSFVKNPSFTFNDYGNIDTTIIVKLIVTAGITGCKDSIEKQIIVKPLPNPEFVLSDSVLCFPNKLTVSNNSFNIPTYKLNTIKWKVIGPDLSSINNDTTSTFTTIHFADNQTGLNKLYQIRLLIKSNFGCEDSIQKTIRIPTRPVANFGFSTDSSCAPAIIVTNNISQYAATFNWHCLSSNVVVNNPSLPNTSIVYPSHRGVVDSVYSVRLIAQTSLGCSDTLIKPFKVFPLPISNFTMDKDSGCSPLNITFFNNSISKKPSNSVWNFGDGLIQTNNLDTLSKAFNGSVFQDTSYVVKLITTSTNGCKDTSNRIVKVKSSAFAKIKLVDTLLCSSLTNPTKLRIENKSFGSVDTFYWDFGDGKTLITTTDSIVNHSYSSEGLFKIVLKAINSCKVTSDSAMIKIQTPPKVNFVKSDSIGCSPLSVSFTNLSTNTFDAKYLWSFGNGNTSNLFNPTNNTYLQSRTSDTTYLISLKVSNICGIFEKRDSIKVLPKPIALFLTSADSGCSPLPIYLINQSTGLPMSYKWYFGNGDSSSRFNPLQLPINYQTVDSISYFGIKLIATNTCGIDSMEKTIKVFPNTVKSFFTTSGNAGCEGLMVRFYDNSTGGNSVSWNFGDGITSLLKNPIHQYNKPGTFYAYQYVNNGCSFDTSFVIISVLPNPQFTISKSAPNICIKNPVQFNANLKDSGVITWYFGDGDTSNAFNPIHNYNSFGKKIITVMLKSFYNSCISIKYDTINVLPIPVITLTADTNQACAYHLFKLNASSPQTNIFNWDFGDKNTGAGSSITHLYQFGGTYTVKILAQTSFGCIDSTTKQFVVFPVPTSAFIYTPKDTCNGPVTVKFTNLSVGANNFLWNFGNGNNSTNVNPTTIYSNVGSYPIQLISNNQFSCYDTSKSEYFVYQTPKASFDTDTSRGCQELKVQFSNTSVYGNSYVWYFGDGDTSSLPNPSHIYKKAGKYDVNLVALAGIVCKDSISKNKIIEVYQKPKSKFILDLDPTFKPHGLVKLKNISDSATRFLWNFGDGNFSNDKELNYNYKDSGNYKITLIAYSIEGCLDTSFVNTIIPGYWKGLFIGNAFTPDIQNVNVNTFKPKALELKSYHMMIYDKWGNLVWQTYNLEGSSNPEGWNGNDFNGNPCIQGTYMWVIDASFTDDIEWEGQSPLQKDGSFFEPELLLKDNSVKRKYGNVTLIR